MRGKRRKKALLIINPVAGKGLNGLPPISKWSPRVFRDRLELAFEPRKTAERVIAILKAKCAHKKMDLRVEPTKRAKHALELARAARNRYDLVIVAGGDGTINEAINGLANSRTTLAIIPFGTKNILALELGIPLDVERAAELIDTGRHVRIDLGHARTAEGSARYFSMVLSVGITSLIIRDMTVKFRKSWKRLAAPINAARHLMTYRWPKIEIRHKKTSAGYFAMIANSRHFAGEYKIANRADMRDGVLDAVVINRRGFWDLFALLFSISTGRPNRYYRREYFQLRNARVSAARKLPVQADGEIIGSSPVDVRIAPKALKVIAMRLWHGGDYKSVK